MGMLKDGKSMEQVSDEILRAYLLRCYATVSKQYGPIENMAPEIGVSYLFAMRKEGKINISLNSGGELVECTISAVN